MCALQEALKGLVPSAFHDDGEFMKGCKITEVYIVEGSLVIREIKELIPKLTKWFFNQQFLAGYGLRIECDDDTVFYSAKPTLGTMKERTDCWEWAVNLNFLPSKMSYVDPIKNNLPNDDVHTGWLRDAKGLFAQMKKPLTIDVENGKKIVFSGFSKGAAEITIVALLFHAAFDYTKFRVVTGGSPEPFGPKMAAYYNSVIPAHVNYQSRCQLPFNYFKRDPVTFTGCGFFEIGEIANQLARSVGRIFTLDQSCFDSLQISQKDFKSFLPLMTLHNPQPSYLWVLRKLFASSCFDELAQTYGYRSAAEPSQRADRPIIGSSSLLVLNGKKILSCEGGMMCKK
jgi:hypothetical protein